MAEYISQGVFQPSIPKHLITEHDLKILNAFRITMTPDGKDKLFLFADDWCTTGYVGNEDGKSGELSEGDLYACFQGIIRRSSGELAWISKETAYTCTENMADGFGGSAVFVTADEVRYFCTSSWLERNITKAEAGDNNAHTKKLPQSQPIFSQNPRTIDCQGGDDMRCIGQKVSEPTNEERAGRIDKVMQAYCLALEGWYFHGDEDDIKDLLTDLMHFCERMKIDFEGNLRVARDNYEHEREGETGITDAP